MEEKNGLGDPRVIAHMRQLQLVIVEQRSRFFCHKDITADQHSALCAEFAQVRFHSNARLYAGVHYFKILSVWDIGTYK